MQVDYTVVEEDRLNDREDEKLIRIEDERLQIKIRTDLKLENGMHMDTDGLVVIGSNGSLTLSNKK